MLSDTLTLSAGTTPPLVRIRKAVLQFRVGKTWGAKRDLRVLDEITLDIQPGEIVALVGESGSGKTTLGKAMLGLYALNSGDIEIERAEGSRRDGPVHDLQMVFQDPLSSFNPRFTIGSSIALPLRMHLHLPEPAISDRVCALLTRVGLNAGFADRYPHEMSGGQLQRAAMGRALALSPRLIVADEAVSKLDVSVRAQILNLIKSLNRSEKIAIVFITHDLGVAQFLADRVAVMYFGRIIELGSSEQVMTRPRHPYTAMLMNARRGEAVANDEAKPNATGCNFASRCPRSLDRCRVERPGAIDAGDGSEVYCFNALP
ncbi:oligopeptide/dipeptide ABC transporter ATP-binding protein [Bradyrhizobium sp. 142]|uniref:ABC transporter ATP-binding protein n=1 Tax=Bradyrhizobium sp. 142 TaxID=2782618 RepID=UPI001FF91535|nr:oligopeptide/dipeptide ABC transporter ATP-binding protein [Bradyrhizobium sp. 142]MCK1732315.1 ABC transporter ATP-binding protein [Bradyrhizobium sp. 142]